MLAVCGAVLLQTEVTTGTCPLQSKQDAVAEMTFDEFRDILTASGSSLVVGGGNTVLDSSEGKCVYATARNNCDANPDIDPNNTGDVAAQHSQTQVLWNKFCDDCNSVKYRGWDSSGRWASHGCHKEATEWFWSHYSLHEATSVACKPKDVSASNANSLCQLQMCGKHKAGGFTSVTNSQELFVEPGVTLPSTCSFTGKSGTLGSIGHIKFQVQCGEMRKLSICVAKTATIWPRNKNCFVKKRCGGVEKVGLTRIYEGGNWEGALWEDDATHGASVQMWLTALKAKAPDAVEKMIKLQCNAPCSNF
jgi:hypothetical protein